MKITIIGGGSYQWSFGFVRQLANSKNLTDLRIMLMDIDADALALVEKICALYRKKNSLSFHLETTTDLDASLQGADYVLVAISTGGLDAMEVDLTVAEKYGIWPTVGDTVGPSGWARAVRNIPVIHHIARRMKALCPDAWCINVTNPLSVLTRVPDREFGIRTLGMCPGVEEHARYFCKLAGHPLEKGDRPDYVVTGIDHGSYFTSLYAGTVDIIHRLKELGYCRTDDKLPASMDSDDAFMGNVGNRAIFAIWAQIGYLPSISDRHAVENHPWFLVNETGTLPYAIHRTSVALRRKNRQKTKERLEQFASGASDDLDSLGHGDDPVCDVIESLGGFRSFTYGSNYKNIGQISALPEGAVVETRCRFDRAGVHPLASPMPDILKIMTLPHVLRQEACIDIALSGSFDELVALVATDPMCSRLAPGQCREMMKEMLEGNKIWIQNPRLLEF